MKNFLAVVSLEKILGQLNGSKGQSNKTHQSK